MDLPQGIRITIEHVGRDYVIEVSAPYKASLPGGYQTIVSELELLAYDGRMSSMLNLLLEDPTIKRMIEELQKLPDTPKVKADVLEAGGLERDGHG